jgi:hypothetical protein
MYAREIIEVKIASLAAKNACKSEIYDRHKGLKLTTKQAQKALYSRVRRGLSPCYRESLWQQHMIFIVQYVQAVHDGEPFERVGDHLQHPDSRNKATREHRLRRMRFRCVTRKQHVAQCWCTCATPPNATAQAGSYVQREALLNNNPNWVYTRRWK